MGGAYLDPRISSMRPSMDYDMSTFGKRLGKDPGSLLDISFNELEPISHRQHGQYYDDMTPKRLKESCHQIQSRVPEMNIKETEESHLSEKTYVPKV